jgi:hypothetical protein
MNELENAVVYCTYPHTASSSTYTVLALFCGAVVVVVVVGPIMVFPSGLST